MQQSSRIDVRALKRAIPIMDIIAEIIPMKRAGREFTGCCPLHQERTPSFYVHPGKGLFTCFGCGAAGDVIRFYELYHRVDFITAVKELAKLGAVDLVDPDGNKIDLDAVQPRQNRRSAAPSAAERRQRYDPDAEERWKAANVEHALEIWRKAKPAAGTLVETYLRARGIDLDKIGGMPPTLRFVASLPSAGQGSPSFPAMVAAIQGFDRQIMGVHRTYLAPDGLMKAHGIKAKKMLGNAWGGACRLSAMCAAPSGRVSLTVGEGIETCLSFMMAMRSTGDQTAVWSALSLGNIAGGGKEPRRKKRPHPTRPGVNIPSDLPDITRPGLIVPDDVQDLLLLGDGDSDPYITRALMARACTRYQRLGKVVRIAWAEPGKDFNDMLRDGQAA